MAGLGRYGPYLLHDGKYAKLTGTAEIFDIGMNAAVVRIAEAAAGGGRGRTKAEPLNTFGPHPTSGGEMKLMEGRFGPYVTDCTPNAKLPKTADAAPQSGRASRRARVGKYGEVPGGAVALKKKQ